MPNNAEQCRTIVNNSEQTEVNREAVTGQQDCRANARREAVTCRRARRSGRRFVVVRPLRTHGEENGPSDTGLVTKTRPRCAWAEARPPAAPAHPGRLFSTARTRLGRGSLGQLGGAGQTAAGPAGSAGEGLDGLAGLAARGRAGRGCRRYEEQTSSQTHGRDLTSSVRARIFPSYALPGSRRREVDLDDCRLAVLMLSRPGRQKQD